MSETLDALRAAQEALGVVHKDECCIGCADVDSEQPCPTLEMIAAAIAAEEERETEREDVLNYAAEIAQGITHWSGCTAELPCVRCERDYYMAYIPTAGSHRPGPTPPQADPPEAAPVSDEPRPPPALLPCPFCGGEAIRQPGTLRDGHVGEEHDPDAYAYAVACRSCAAEGGWAKNQGGADRWWNMRSLEPLPAGPRCICPTAGWCPFHG